MRKLVVLFVLLLLLTGCGNKSKDIAKTSCEPGSKSNPTTTAVPSAMPSIEPTNIDNDTESKIKQLLPEGAVEASILKSIYVYPSAADEKRGKVLERKYREGLEKNWDKILKNSSTEEKDVLEHLYNKNVDFRDNVLSVLKYTIKPSDVGLTYDEFSEFTRLYDLAEKKNVEDKKTKLGIKFDKNKLSIVPNPKSKYIDKIDIDFSNSSLSVGGKVFKEARKSDEFDNDFSVAETQVNRKKFNIDGEYYDTLLIWQNFNSDDQFYFSIHKLQGSESIVLRYCEFIFKLNKYSEDLILIKK